MLVTSFWIEPKILFHNIFRVAVKCYWVKQLKYVCITIIFFIISLLPCGLLMLVLKIILIFVLIVSLFLLTSFKSKEIKILKQFVKFGIKKK